MLWLSFDAMKVVEKESQLSQKESGIFVAQVVQSRVWPSSVKRSCGCGAFSVSIREVLQSFLTDVIDDVLETSRCLLHAVIPCFGMSSPFLLCHDYYDVSLPYCQMLLLLMTQRQS